MYRSSLEITVKKRGKRVTFSPQCNKLSSQDTRTWVWHPLLQTFRKWLSLLCSATGRNGGASDEEPACQCRQKRCEFNPWVGKIPWRRAGTPLKYFCLENPHGQRSLAGYSPWGSQRVRHNWSILGPRFAPFTTITPGISQISFFLGEIWHFRCDSFSLKLCACSDEWYH